MSTLPERHPGGSELSSYLDGGLSDRRTKAVARHVEACPACGRELAALRKVSSALASQEEVEPRPGWLSRVQEQVAAGARPASTARIRHRLRLRLAGGIAPAAVAPGTGGLWLPPPPPAPPPPHAQPPHHPPPTTHPLTPPPPPPPPTRPPPT